MGIFNKILNNTIPSETLFMSSEFQNFMEFTTNSELRRAKKKQVRVYIVQNGPEETAYTTMEKMVINYGHHLIGNLPDKQKQFVFLKGFNGHELGHLLYDDFYLLMRMSKVWKETRALYPLSNHLNILDDELRQNYDDIKEHLKDEKKSNMLLRYYKELNNILADSFVNYQVMKKSVRYGTALGFTLHQFKKEILSEDYHEMMSRTNVTSSSLLLTLIHKCCVYGIVYDDAENELNKLAVRMIPIYQKIKRTEYGETRETYYQKILCMIWPVLKADIDAISTSVDDTQQAMDNLLYGAPGASEGLSTKPVRTVPQTYDETISTEIEEVEAGDYDDIIQTLQNSSSDGCDSGDSAQTQGNEEHEKNQGETSKKGGNQKTQSKQTSETDDGGTDNNTPYDYHIYDKDVENFGDNIVTEEKFELNDIDSREIQRIMDDIYSHQEEMDKEKEHGDKLIEFNHTLSYPAIHTGLKVCIAYPYEFDKTQNELERSMRIKLHPIAQRMADEISEIPMKRRKGGKVSGFYSGKRINLQAITRREKKIFERNNLPTDRPKLAIQVLVDESGSTSGNRIESEKIACLLFRDMAEQMKIPIGIIGHKGDTATPSKDECDVRLNIYSDFASNRFDYRRILGMKSGGDNRDGYAIVYAAERLLTQKADEHICIILTDGKPNAEKNHYHGALAVQDIRYILQQYKRRGVKFIAAAIGDDKATIRQIYGEDFVDIKSPDKIPQFLADVLKSVYL